MVRRRSWSSTFERIIQRRVDAVTCVLAAQRLAADLPWFGQRARDIRMLIEDDDLGPAIAGSR